MFDQHFNDEAQFLEEEVRRVDQELRRFEGMLRESHKQRVQLLRRLNAIHSRTRLLPDEVLSLVFQSIALPMKKYPDDCLLGPKFFPVLLGSVSYHWRQVAWSTPSLWSTLRLDVPKAEHLQRSAAAMLAFCLRNVAFFPVTLTLKFEPGSRLSDIDHISEVLFRDENTRKIRNLHLAHPPGSFLSHCFCPFSQLLELSIQAPRDMGECRSPLFAGAPLLRRISLSDSLRALVLPWSTVTFIELKRVSILSALHCLLHASPSLAEFHFTILDHNHEGNPPQMPDTLTFPHLECLTWSFRPNQFSDLFLRRIRLPVLRSLVWHQNDYGGGREWVSGVHIFFQNLSSAPLTTLTLSQMFEYTRMFPSAPEPSIIEYIYLHTPHVEILRLDDLRESSLSNALSLLIPTSSTVEHHLPKLRAIEVTDCSNDYYLQGGGTSRGYRKILDDHVLFKVVMLLRDHGTEGLGLTIDFNGGVTRVEWPMELKEALRAIVRDGANISVLEKGKRVDWL
ncbi:hypothetical protein P691DRAFT_808640 [Macrolepiota fuliginosa MF-IS2]|uniref:F-box domain-containing protein n=1 Tax=Macrolepiota fuliginosa MF-IS2 TaxID=1400762 RepID=A0A9P5XI49_9AGAR|nr:hypothetical protein P691DRAFT_808640 [Macrolepiota fuliginosa MF-IS2]